MKIYHNPRCTKSRQTLALLEGEKVEIVEYLKTPPSAKELKAIIAKLGIAPEALLRKGEALFKEKYKGKKYSDSEWIEIMVKHPVLIERPIVVSGDKAVLGRPPENVKQIL